MIMFWEMLIPNTIKFEQCAGSCNKINRTTYNGITYNGNNNGKIKGNNNGNNNGIRKTKKNENSMLAEIKKRACALLPKIPKHVCSPPSHHSDVMISDQLKPHRSLCAIIGKSWEAIEAKDHPAQPCCVHMLRVMLVYIFRSSLFQTNSTSFDQTLSRQLPTTGQNIGGRLWLPDQLHWPGRMLVLQPQREIS